MPGLPSISAATVTEPIRLGTRASTLARTQSATVGDALAALSGRSWTEVLVTTPGDDTTKPLDQPGRAHADNASA